MKNTKTEREETITSYGRTEFPEWGFRIFAERIDGGASVIQDGDDFMYRTRLSDEHGVSIYVFRGNRAEDAIAAMFASGGVA